jgi:long-chain acyl-CoA synthetase
MRLTITEQSNLSDLFFERVREAPDAAAYRQFEGSQWRDWNWAEVGREVGRWRAAFRREGLKPGERVALCLHNRFEWVCFDQAALSLGLVVLPLYFDDRADNMAFCLNDAGARFLFLENAAQWSALSGLVQTIERVVLLEGEAPAGGKAVRLADWLPARGDDSRDGGGRAASGTAAETLARSPAGPNDLATLVYTSGTTGRPKGVMLSHRNILSNVIASMQAIPAHADDRFLSFLPLSHMFERTCGYYSAIWAGAQTVYARSISQLAEDLQQQQPPILVSVPRIFERIWGKMQENMPVGTPKRRLFDQAVAVGWRRFSQTATLTDHLLWPLLKLLVAKKLYRRLGGRIRLIIVGGAAFAPNLARVFMGLGLPILQGYGLTETSPVLAANRAGDNDPNSVGRSLQGIELRCDQNGELLARGPNIMLGYWNNPTATAAMVDPDGWLHTGDLVRIRDGRVYITGRVKEIIVLSSGEKVPPGDAEQALLQDPVFEQVMVLGEGRAKLGLLCVSRLEDLTELCARANAQLKDFPGYAKISHIARAAEPWTVENGLLTPTLKLKRKEMLTRFAREIESMYATTDNCDPKKKTS